MQTHTLSPWENRTLALAGMFQAATLVQKLATTGSLQSAHLDTAIHSLFEQNPKETADVYGSLSNVLTGLERLKEVLKRNNSPEGNDIVRYVMGIIHLQKKLSAQPDMLNSIASHLDKAKNQAQVFDNTHENVSASLANIYTTTISTFSFRIQVNGDYNYLQQQRIADQIRVLLLAGIRSAVLWRQLGGTRMQVIFKRKAIIATADNLIKQSKEELLH